MRLHPARILVAAGLWVGLFQLNAWAFQSFEWNPVVNWVFLPAAVRLLAVLLWGWEGCLGIWLGTLVTNQALFGTATQASLAVASISALAPWLAVGAARMLLAIPSDLAGLRPASLLVLAGASALSSALLHTLYFSFTKDSTRLADDLLPMLVGDVAGTLIVLYTLRAVLLAWHRARP